ncbi:MAG: permease [Caldilineaceae bacterium]|nr:permease [Caldilineaceae bacterium]
MLREHVEEHGQEHAEDQPGADSPANRRLRWLLTLVVLALAVGALFINVWSTGAGLPYFSRRFQTLVTIFLSIFIEAVPFLIAGSLVSGLIHVFVDQSMLDRYLPRQPFFAAMAGASMGLLFPVCECGVVPVTRRLYEKGLPMSIGVAFLLAAPIINPIVLLSTYAAFGWGPVLWGRFAISFAVASAIGLIFSLAKPRELLLPQVLDARHAACDLHSHHAPGSQSFHQRLQEALITGGDDFLDMARYLILGSLLAAAMQTLTPREALLAIGQGPILSVWVMQALAFVLSVCSTVDAFLALAFVGSFTAGSILAFLTFGPMVDIKSALMFLGVFRRRIVFYLILLPLMLTMVLSIAWNLF